MAGLKSRTKEQSDKAYRNVGQIKESKNFDGMYVDIDRDSKDGKYQAEIELLLVDKKTNAVYTVKQLSLFKPHPDAPKFVVERLVVDLNSEYQVEKKMDLEDSQEES